MEKLNLLLTEETLAHTKRIIDECGPRLAGTDSCKKAARLIEEDLNPYCDKVEKQEFKFAQNAFINFLKITPPIYLLGVVLMFFTGKIYLVAAICCFTFAMFFIVIQFLLYYHWFDFLYRKYKGYNVIGVIEPEGEVKQQIVISGHHDTAREFRIIDKFPKIYAPLATLMTITFILSTVLPWIALFVGNPIFTIVVRYILTFGLLFVMPSMFFTTKKAVPGASDNMIAISIITTITKVFGTAKKQGNNMLKHTRIIIASLDAEESGLRGAYAYTRKSKNDLLKTKTYNYNIDSVLHANTMYVFTSDIQGLVKGSKAMANEIVSISDAMAYNLKAIPFPFGGGGTDAGEFSRIGVEAVNLFGMSPDGFDENSVYHTMRDTVDKIEPLAVEKSLNLLYNYILIKDKQV